jgi:hypothetical protein
VFSTCTNFQLEELNKLAHQDECEIRKSKDHQQRYRCQWSVGDRVEDSTGQACAGCDQIGCATSHDSISSVGYDSARLRFHKIANGFT